MLDIKYIKEHPDDVINRLAAKGKDAAEDIAEIIRLDGERRALIVETEGLKAEQNKTTKLIPQYKKEGKDVAPIFAEMKELASRAKSNDEKLKQIETEYMNLMLGLPNLPDPDLKPGEKENNEPLRYFGEPHKFDFEPKNHVDLCTELGLIDYKRGVKLSGAGFWIDSGMGARLEWALLNFFIDTHLKNGFELYNLINEKTYKVLSLTKMTNFRGVYAGQFIVARIFEFEGEYYVIEISSVLSHSQKEEAYRYAVMKLVHTPRMLYYDNPEKEEEVKKTIKEMQKNAAFLSEKPKARYAASL